ncbi:hypothetical protein OG311_38045 (plasmid) [Streptomyces sp. NBC_01343]|uniref:hypothetical protein n=1 Tax=Streptomyces sp. NBC_01343 TaxID=2903832 RepID=UPI002E1540CA|nr:hypothetical protein OG311_38045 [Streptomyces sp. NBC_01343]
MTTTLRTVSVSEHVRAQLAAHGITAHHTWDRADSYLTLVCEDQAVITISGLTTAGHDVSITHSSAQHLGWLAACRTAEDTYEIVYDTYDQAVPYEEDTAALVTAVLNTLQAPAA